MNIRRFALRSARLAGAALAAAFVAGTAAPAPAAPAPAGLAQGLCLYLPFEGSGAPSYCEGRADVTLGAGSLGEGRVGRGYSLVGSAMVSLPSLGNFRRGRGTLAFWHQARWHPADGGDGNCILMREANFQLCWQRARTILFFMTGKSEAGTGFHWDYSVASREPMRWREGEWHHVTVTWDSAGGEKQLFFDGRRVAEGRTPWLRSDSPDLNDRIDLGSPTAPGLYDEWAIWDRVLSPDEIAALAQEPEAAARALSARKPAEAEAAPPVSFELARLKAEESIVDPGETFRLPTVARNRGGTALDLEVRLALVDVFGQVLERRTVPLALPPGARKALSFDWRAGRSGVFKAVAEYDWQGRAFRADLGGFAVWPKGKLRPTVNSFFGHHVNAWYGGEFIRQAARLGLSWERDHDMMQTTRWPQFQPAAGKPEAGLDFQLGYCREAGMPVLGQFFGTPAWAVARAGAPPTPPILGGLGGAPAATAKSRDWLPAPPRLDAFREYVRAVVERYRGDIHVWEVWNEPDTSVFWTGTPEEFAALAQAGCRAAHAADPACKVLVAGFTGAAPKEWLERAAKAGAFADADGISFHGYAPDVAGLRFLVEIMRDLAARYAPAGRKLPLWNTEWGVGDTTFYVDGDFPGLPPRRLLPAPSYLQGAARGVQMECVSLALGVERSFYYLHNPAQGAGAYENTSAIEATGAPRPKLLARVALEYLTRGAKAEALVERKEGAGMAAVVFARPDGTSLAAVWLEGKGKASLTAAWPEGTLFLDLFANPLAPPAAASLALSEVPIYLQTPLPAARLAERLRGARITPAPGTD